MKKIFILSTIVSVLSLAHSVNTYTEYNYNNGSKLAFGSNLKIDFKNITGESKLKFGEFGIDESVFLNFQRNIDFKNEYNLRLNVAKNVDFVGKVKFDVEKRDNNDTIKYEIEPAFEMAHKDFKFLLGLNEKGTKETFDTGVKLGVDYVKSGFENKFRLGAWYLTKATNPVEFNSDRYTGIFNGIDFDYSALKLSDKGEKGYSESKIFIPFEISAVDNINYSKGKFETKNEINVNYISKDVFSTIKINSKDEDLKTTNLLAKERNLVNNFTLKLKSENSYKVTDTITAKLNLENEFKKDMTGYKYSSLVNYKEDKKDVKDIVKRDEYSNVLKNTTTIKGALNYTNQIDSKNKFSVEPSLKLEVIYGVTKSNEIKDVTKKDVQLNLKNMDESAKSAIYSLIPRIEATYENKVTDRFTFALKPFIELKFGGGHVLDQVSTFQIKSNEAGKEKVEANLLSTFTEDEKKTAKENKVVVKTTKGGEANFVYNNVTAGAKLEFNYAW